MIGLIFAILLVALLATGIFAVVLSPAIIMIAIIFAILSIFFKLISHIVPVLVIIILLYLLLKKKK